ncbi:hypothetical protein EDD18DRAFT_1184354 [Armillaria luteobubalina]|uniref:DCD domain-containing protein n=1 Tax=Armillaria luteobubalina TaxID=153913 RepID=A0AA39PXF6_9AGAR|nr:hypothetical protein EDD18DRAFT_1184354 [Armillaria luteobubalina]
MNVFPGLRIFFYDSTGQLVSAVVESTSRAADGTEIVTIKINDGRTATLPSASIFRG